MHFQFLGEFEKNCHIFLLNVWYISPVIPSGPELLLLGKLFFIDLILLLSIGLFRYFLFLQDSVFLDCLFLKIYPFLLLSKLRRGGKNTQNCTKKNLHDPDNHDGVITHLEPDILECEVKWALDSITTNKASGGDGIPVELFQILNDDAVKVLHSICQQIWET